MAYFLTLTFQASEIPITDKEVLDLIGEKNLSDIKEKDKDPLFAAYVVGQEGTSKPKILDGEQKPLQWLKSSISKMVGAITKGAKLFYGHNKDNSTENRETFGEVVAATEKQVNGKSTAIIVAHVDPSKKDFVTLQDIISIEAVTEVFETAKEYIVDTVEAVKGFALGSSEKWSPGIPGARQLLMVQAMATDTLENQDLLKNQKDGKSNMAINLAEVHFDDIKQLIKDRKIWPSQIYKSHEIFGEPVKRKDGTIHYQGGDRVFQDDANEFLAAQVKEATNELANQVKEWETKHTELSNKYGEVFQKAAVSEFLPELEKIAKEKSYPDTALKLLKVETKGIKIPEDPAERAKLQGQIFQIVEEKHKELFGELGAGQATAAAEKKPGTGGDNLKTGEEDTF